MIISSDTREINDSEISRLAEVTITLKSNRDEILITREQFSKLQTLGILLLIVL